MLTRIALLSALLLLACAPAPEATPDAGTQPQPGPNATVEVFSAEHITGSHREAEATVQLPQGLFTKITLHWRLECPPNGCDPWDRRASLEVQGSGGERIEIARLMTPYGVGHEWTYDVTALAPVLTGQRTFKLFLDTWVDGWNNTIQLVYEGGVPERVPVEVLLLWRGEVVFGDPSKPVADALPPRSLSRAEGERLEVRLLLTGHGQGNQGNCAEFCKKTHVLSVGESRSPYTPWRGDCAQNEVSDQHGTWQYPRAGWCPGSDVRPAVIDVTDSVPPGTEVPAKLELAAYENSCRPGVSACSGCVGGSDCNYNSNGHTEPFIDTSGVLVRYR